MRVLQNPVQRSMGANDWAFKGRGLIFALKFPRRGLVGGAWAAQVA